jgi:hypothetical protein
MAAPLAHESLTNAVALVGTLVLGTLALPGVASADELSPELVDAFKSWLVRHSDKRVDTGTSSSKEDAHRVWLKLSSRCSECNWPS